MLGKKAVERRFGGLRIEDGIMKNVVVTSDLFPFRSKRVAPT